MRDVMDDGHGDGDGDLGRAPRLGNQQALWLGPLSSSARRSTPCRARRRPSARRTPRGNGTVQEHSHWRGAVVSSLCCATRRGRLLPREICSLQENKVFGFIGCYSMDAFEMSFWFLTVTIAMSITITVPFGWQAFFCPPLLGHQPAAARDAEQRGPRDEGRTSCA